MSKISKYFITFVFQIILFISCTETQVIESSLYVKFGEFDKTKSTIEEQIATASIKFENLILENSIPKSGYALIDAAIKKDPKLRVKASIGEYGPLIEAICYEKDGVKIDHQWSGDKITTCTNNPWCALNLIANTEKAYAGSSWYYYISDDDNVFTSSSVGSDRRVLKNGSKDFWAFDSYSFPK